MTVRPDLANTHRNHNNVTPLAYTRGTIRNNLTLLHTSECGVINLDEDVENRYDYGMDEFENLENRTGTNNNGVMFETRDLPMIYMDQGHVLSVKDKKNYQKAGSNNK